MLMSSLAKARVATSDSQNVTIKKAPGDKRYCAGLESPLTTLPGSWRNIPHFHQQPVCCEILSYRQLSCGATQLDRCNSVNIWPLFAAGGGTSGFLHSCTGLWRCR